MTQVPHEYGPSRIGHGEAQCIHCHGTNRENAIIAPNHCAERAKALSTRPAPDMAAVVEALELERSFGCPLCNGDCASANPPVMACPMAAIDAALQSLRGQP